MDFLILVFVMGLAGHQIYLHAMLRREFRRLHVTLVSATRSHQGRMRKLSRSSPEAIPDIDRARTTKRDTDDIPATGRMGPLMPSGGGDRGSIDHDG